MKNYTALIIDDEPLAREQIKNYLIDFPEIKLLSECADGFEGAKAIRQLNPDIVFLDIQMPRLNGFEMIEILDKLPIIIFSTAYDEFALKAFELNALDYLLKPYSRQRFSQAINKAIDHKNSDETQLQIKSLSSEIVKQNQRNNRIIIKDSGNLILLDVVDVLYLEAADDYVQIYTEKKRFMHQKTLSWYENFLDNNFLRVHRSFIVNLKYLSKIEPYGKETFVAALKNHPFKVPVSRSGHKALMEILNKS